MSLSRRRLLAGLTAVGGFGSFAGAGTAALLADRESVTIDGRASELELHLSAGGDDADLPLAFPDLQFGESRTQTVCVGLDEGPGWTWVRLCGDVGRLGELLEADLTVEYGSGGETVELLSTSAPLAAVVETVNDSGDGVDGGSLLADQGPVAVGDLACLRLTLTVPETDDETERAYLRSSPGLALTLQVRAEQSNNNPNPGSPWNDTCAADGGGPVGPPNGPPLDPAGEPPNGPGGDES
jgi:hypothetical protein